MYDIALDENDEIPAERQLNLTLGEWLLYLTGTKGEVRLTTVPLALTVKESGLIDAPLHPMPLSVAEQIDSKAAAMDGVGAPAQEKRWKGKGATLREFCGLSGQ